MGQGRRARAKQLSRRAFVGGAAAALTGCADSEDAPPGTIVPAKGIAIIGAGLAGLSCAYWLGRAGVESTVYEASARTGGRILTLRKDLQTPLFAELGGEFIEGDHAAMRVLALELGISLAPYVVESGQRVFWVGERRVPEERIAAELTDFMSKVTAELEAAQATDRALAYLDETPLARWLERNAEKPEQADLLALLQAAFRAELGTETDQQPALNLVQLFGSEPSVSRFAKTTNYRALDGAERFPLGLEDRRHTRVLLESRLVALEKRLTAFTLTLEGPTGIASQVEAERVVLAVPFGALRTLNLNAADISAEKRALIETLSYGNHTKLVATFGKRDWGAVRRVLADLPFQLIWDSSPDLPGPNALLTNLLAGRPAMAQTASADAFFQNMVPDVERALMTPLSYLSGSARRVRWGDLPLYGGSVSSPRWGQWLAQSVAGAPEGNLHFCGEHTSVDFRGTMEGAAESGALVAYQILEDMAVSPPERLAELVRLKTRVSQPCLREGDPPSAQALSRRRAVVDAHAAFVRALSER